MKESADVIVATQIADRFIACGLIRQERAERFRQDLAAGRVKIGDWNLLAETEVAKLAEGSDDK